MPSATMTRRVLARETRSVLDYGARLGFAASRSSAARSTPTATDGLEAFQLARRCFASAAFCASVRRFTRGRAGVRAAAGATAAVTASPGNAETAALTEPAMAWRGRRSHLWNGDAEKPNK